MPFSMDMRLTAVEIKPVPPIKSTFIGVGFLLDKDKELNKLKIEK